MSVQSVVPLPLVIGSLLILGVLCSCDTRGSDDSNDHVHEFQGLEVEKTINVNEQGGGSLQSSDPTLSEIDSDLGDQYVDLYEVTLDDDQTVLIKMESNSVDPSVYLWKPDGTLLRVDDDGGTGLNSRTTIELSPGSYVLGASSYSVQEGSYSLSLE